MNKLIIVLLAICLVSVHAFVKRETAEENNGAQDLISKIQKDLSGFGDTLQKSIDPEKLKQGFNEFVDNVNKVFSQKPAEAKA